ncbi:gp58-like family protein, partial [Leuconostoc mesenteroides]
MRGNGNVYVARPYVGVQELVEGGYTAGTNNNNQTILSLFKDNWSIGISDNIGAITSGIVGNASQMSLISKNITLDGNTTVTGDFYALGGNFRNLNASN